MRAALALARRGLGQVAPNPAVGCLLVQNGRIVGRGWTQPGGRPHAETEALKQAGAQAGGATAYVTLEPCAHTGQTGPCADALVEAGIARCVVALKDPDSRVSGRGVDRLAKAGIGVDLGLCADEARELNRGFFSVQEQGRPLITLKLATTVDGRIATKTGESQWITGPAARARAHLLRAGHDAVLVGSGTAIADNPRLDVRLAGLEGRSPLRVVIDGRLRLPLTHDLVRRAAERPSCLITGTDVEATRLGAYRDSGMTVLQVSRDEDHRPILSEAMQGLAKLGVTRLLVEGGAYISAGLLKAGLVDRLVCFRAGLVMGGDGLPAAVSLGVESLQEAPKFLLKQQQTIGADSCDTFERAQS